MKKRNINVDFVKCIAVFFVISVHFFIYTGFYEENINDLSSSVAVLFRTLFMICVPLFMIVTGYLMNKKEVNKRYYLGIFRVIIIYVLDAFLYLGYHSFYLNEFDLTLRTIVSRILNFEIGYSWYVEMYIGLFLLIPFLNLIYNNLDTKFKKKVLLFTLLVTTSFQGILNFKYNLIPDYWISLYPITYYYFGCYLKEYQFNISKFVSIICIIVTIFVSALFNILISNGNILLRGVHNDFPSIFNLLVAVFVFDFIKKLNFEKVGTLIKKCIVTISNLSFGMYLVSSIVDDFIYNQFFNGDVICCFSSYIKTVPLIFLLSILIAYVLNCIYKLIDRFVIKKIFKKMYLF